MPPIASSQLGSAPNTRSRPPPFSPRRLPARSQLSDEASKVASRFSLPQRDYFKAVAEAIAVDAAVAVGVPESTLLHVDAPPPGAATQAADASQGAGPSTSAARAPAPVAAAKRLTKAEKVAALAALANDGWLQACDGGYTIGVRPGARPPPGEPPD